MNETIQLTMFVVALIIVMWTHVKPGDVAKQPLIASGLVAAIALFGLAWMTATYLDANPIGSPRSGTSSRHTRCSWRSPCSWSAR